MALDKQTLEKLFPMNEAAFTAPFNVVTTKDGEVHIKDKDGSELLTFCRYTQMPLGDEEALKAEVSYWEIEAKRISAALNTAYTNN